MLYKVCLDWCNVLVVSQSILNNIQRSIVHFYCVIHSIFRTFRVPIRTRNSDNSIGNLVFAPEQLFTFGVSENKDEKTQSVNGFTLPLTLFNNELKALSCSIASDIQNNFYRTIEAFHLPGNDFSVLLKDITLITENINQRVV